MIKVARTNTLPGWLFSLCLILMLLRGLVIVYRTYGHSTPIAQTIVWGQPKALDKKRRDFLSKPTLYYFCDESDSPSRILTSMLADAVFSNREIVKYMGDNFQLVKVVHTSSDSGLVSKLSQQLHIYAYPTVVVTLVDGTIVDSCQWQTDRTFKSFMQEVILQSRFEKAANQAMCYCDFKMACDGYGHSDLSRRWLAPIFSEEESIYRYIALRHEHHDTEAKDLLKQELNRVKHTFPFQPNSDAIVKYRFLLGELTEAEYINLQKASLGSIGSFNHYLLGELRLLDGQLPQAKEQFKRVLAKKDTWAQTYLLARAELISLGEKVPDLADDSDKSEGD